MKIATWNVNSIRVRMERLLAWLAKVQPDVVCLQELKVTDDALDTAPLAEAGYHAAVHGQKTYNGVAILSRVEPAQVECGLGDGVDDPQARLIAADVGRVRVISAYFPNGSPVGTQKWTYKLEWMARLGTYLHRNVDPAEELVLCGDFNVAIDDKDVARPAEWADSCLCQPAAREALAAIRDWGLVDVFRKHHPQGGIYSWWDYRQLGFPKNNGLRLDHIYATRPLADLCTSAEVDRDERKGEKPSDHAPVVAVFED